MLFIEKWRNLYIPESMENRRFIRNFRIVKHMDFRIESRKTLHCVCSSRFELSNGTNQKSRGFVEVRHESLQKINVFRQKTSKKSTKNHVSWKVQLENVVVLVEID